MQRAFLQRKAFFYVQNKNQKNKIYEIAMHQTSTNTDEDYMAYSIWQKNKK
jgi:hypothetical protein